jgi:TLC domain
MNYTIPILQLLKMNSKATYCELSNPFMHLAKRTRQPKHFVLFAVVYTLCRILWIPIMYYQLMTYEPSITTETARGISKITWYHPISCILVAFYILNLYWYMKIINILVTGGGNSKSGQPKSSGDTKKDQ